MSKEKFISVGIDVGSAFSWMSIADPGGQIISKPFKIIHNDVDSLRRALDAMKKKQKSGHP